MNKKKFLISMLITILVASAIGGGLLAANTMFDGDLPDALSKLLDRADSDKINVLVMGVDKGKARADVIILASLDPKNEEVNLLSIPRDTRVKVSDSRHDKINHTLGYENGEETITKMVKQLTGMPIHYYCEIDFEGFRDVIDILGGVEFDVPVNMHYDDPYQDLHIHVDKGLQVLNGADAEGVVRFRASYATGDLGRIGVQQDFLKALFQQKLQAKYLRKAPALLREISDHLKTNFPISKATKYVKMLKKMEGDSLETFMLPGASKTIGGASYYVCDSAATKELVLTEFGYPEDEAKKLKKSKASDAE